MLYLNRSLKTDIKIVFLKKSFKREICEEAEDEAYCEGQVRFAMMIGVERDCCKEILKIFFYFFVFFFFITKIEFCLLSTSKKY